MRSIAALFLAVALTSLLAAPSPAHAASVSIAFSADPTEERPVTVTVAGSADASTRLWVYAYEATSACPGQPSTLYASYELSGALDYTHDGDAVAAGPFSRQYTYTPASATGYRFCAYVSASASAVASASDSKLLTPRAPNASVAIGMPADPTEQKPISFTVTGASEVDRRLWVYASAGLASCPSQPSTLYPSYELSGSVDYSHDGDLIAAGSYSRTYAFTPADSGAYRLCAYVAETASAIAEAKADRALAVREPTAQATITVSAGAVEEQPVTISVAGAAENDGLLFVYATPDTVPCSSQASSLYPSYELSGRVDYSHDGDAIAAGAYARSYTFTPDESGTYRVCAYVSESASAPPNATSSVDFAVAPPAAALEVGIDPPSYEGAAMLTVGVRATSAASRRLFVTITTGTTQCPATPSGSTSELTGTQPHAVDGDALTAGAVVSRTFPLGVSADTAAYRACAYIAEGNGGAVEFTASAVATRRDRGATVALAVPATVEHGRPASIVASGWTNVGAQLFTYVGPGTVDCAGTPQAHSRQSGVTAVTTARGLGSGPFSVPSSYGPALAGAYRVCSYVGSSAAAVPDSSAGALFTVKPDPALLPALITKDGDKQRDRLTLSWRRGPSGSKEVLAIYDTEPTDEAEPVAEYAVEDDDVLDVSDFKDERKVRVRRHLGYGTFFWRVERTDGRSTLRSAVGQVRVVPRPLSKRGAKARSKVTLRSSSRRAGTARLVVTSSPRTKVRVVVRRNGRTFARRSFTEGVGGTRGVNFALSCSATGRFTYVVTMRDPYGTTVTRRGSWRLSASRCARLIARERAAARRKAAEKRRRAAQRERSERSGGSGGSGGSGDVPSSGGCDGDPGATPYPQFPGQRDGDGDGCYGESR